MTILVGSRLTLIACVAAASGRGAMRDDKPPEGWDKVGARVSVRFRGADFRKVSDTLRGV